MEPPHSHRVIELKIPSELGYEKIAREAVATVARRLGFDEERIADIKLAIAEACTNAIEYGSKSGSLTKIVVVLTADEEKLEILVKDPGFGAPPPNEVTVPDIHKMVKGEAKLGGMGLYIIRELMDKAQFIPDDEGRGNHFQMIIYRLDSDEADAEAPATNRGENS